MFTLDQVMDSIKTARELDAAMSTPITVNISHGEVLRIIANDLAAKHRTCDDRGDTEWCNAIRKVLSYYLTEDEIKILLEESK